MFLKFLTVVWLVSLYLSVAIAVERDQPLVEAFMPMKKTADMVWQLILLTWVALLFAVQFYGCPIIFGQQPLTWAIFLIDIYLWIGLGRYYLNKP